MFKLANKSSIRNEILAVIDEQRRSYALRWSQGDASHFNENSYYDWMKGFVADYKNILEIGTGDGSSTLALARDGHNIISIEENYRCLELASEKISAEGIKCRCLYRENINASASARNYSISYNSIDIPPEDGVTLIQGDVLNDTNLIEWLKRLSKFDAIICWLIGSHGARQPNRKISSLGLNTPELYRLKTQNTIYELADEILRENGILHIVDRGPSLDSEELRNSCIEGHKEQAEPTSLKFEKLDCLPYDLPTNGIIMGNRSGIISDDDCRSIAAFSSIISRKVKL